MSRQVVITGLGPVSAVGLGIGPTWEALLAGRSGIGRISFFDASGFPCQIAGEVRDFKVSDYVPKTYRKATKVMARDIELAVAAADLAARDAGLVTKSTAGNGQPPTYPAPRTGAQIGAGLIAAEINELTSALVESRNGDGAFDIHKWGSEGMDNLTPLWLLKYLPNMLACHVTIVHDAQGPSNTITCAEASSILSIGESLRVIQRGAADLCFCGGIESKGNMMSLLRQTFTRRLTTDGNDQPEKAVRPFCKTASGTVVGEGGGIVTLEAIDTFKARPGGKAYAVVAGFGASQTVNPRSRNLVPDEHGRGIAIALRSALREAGVTPEEIDLVVAFGTGCPDHDRAEAAALKSVLGSRVGEVPVVSTKASVGLCGAGAGGLDVCVAAKALAEQTVPAVINCDQPIEGLLAGSAPPRKATLRCVLTYSSSLGGQNTALVLRRFEG